ncbi:hypothetical protein D5S18_11385 [Nocardia panacis]|uniref:Uncharacterized protein n=1 Tax=Nocardia panacis TaxID=2340916 RepID=A0A3A4KNA2_9NOCA|nr:hypothetical protein [Nocardia panacis]RJO76827.1 hypothetical protein D5S18_11385 [Nocardia panacis]
MFELCRSPHDIVDLLRYQFGLPVQLVAGRPMIATGSVLSAVVMPAALGTPVLAALDCDYIAPVVADPGDRTWTFLVTPPAPALPVEVPLRRALAVHAVTIVPAGRNLMLPCTDSPQGWHWAATPTPALLRLPPRSTILSAVLHQTRTHAAIP